VPVRRLDSSVLGRVERTPQGGIKVPARVTRVGVFAYKMGDGTTRRELRPPEEVFAPESLSSLNDAPVTDLHPGEPVTPANWRAYSIGHVSTPAVRAGDFVETTLAVQDGSSIAKIDNGERAEVSLGYQCEVEDAAGDFNGEQYDAIQRSIRYNHVAIGPVGWGRAGRAVALRLDSADGYIEEKEDATMKIKIGGKEYEIGSPEATKALADLEGKAARTDALEAEIKTAKRGKLVEAVKTLRMRAGKRLDEAEAKAVESASDLDLMLMLLKTDPSFDAENTDEAYVRGCFAAYVKRAAADTTSTDEPVDEPLDSTTTDPVPSITAPAPDLDRALDSINAVRPRKVPPTSKTSPKSAADKTRTDAEDDALDSDKARQRMIEDNRKAGTSALRLVRK
jgi:hypothetical protein